eukprot:8925943-Pyramimonas_sp.AAC.1
MGTRGRSDPPWLFLRGCAGSSAPAELRVCEFLARVARAAWVFVPDRTHLPLRTAIEVRKASA